MPLQDPTAAAAVASAREQVSDAKGQLQSKVEPPSHRSGTCGQDTTGQDRTGQDRIAEDSKGHPLSHCMKECHKPSQRRSRHHKGQGPAGKTGQDGAGTIKKYKRTS